MRFRRRAPGLAAKYFVPLAVAISVVALAAVFLAPFLGSALHRTLFALAAALVAAALLARFLSRPVREMVTGLAGMVSRYRGGDFSTSLIVRQRDELGALVQTCNEMGDALREQRVNLAQRELLLETVMRHSPAALILVDQPGRITYANAAARRLFSSGRTLKGTRFMDSLAAMPEAVRIGMGATHDSLFSADIDGLTETFHKSERSFVLQGQPYRLYLLKQLTRELSRQEVATWKKVFRIMSHELHNSLGPISSLAQTGAQLAHRNHDAAIGTAFEGIAERSRHLHEFLNAYAEFAKLPTPKRARVDWGRLVGALAQQQGFRLMGKLPERPGCFDRAQIERALVNVLRNAHEAGGPPAAIELSIRITAGENYEIEVSDRGAGMSQVVLAQALLPFYSTKKHGTGLGLALAREICDAHGGRIMLANREGGGLTVTLSLPVCDPQEGAEAPAEELASLQIWPGRPAGAGG